MQYLLLHHNAACTSGNNSAEQQGHLVLLQPASMRLQKPPEQLDRTCCIVLALANL